MSYKSRGVVILTLLLAFIAAADTYANPYSSIYACVSEQADKCCDRATHANNVKLSEAACALCKQLVLESCTEFFKNYPPNTAADGN